MSEYAARALDRAENGRSKENIMCVIDEACSACVQINYEITNLCRGCTARSCQVNCPKKAVHVKESGRHGLTMMRVSVVASAIRVVPTMPLFIFPYLVRRLVP